MVGLASFFSTSTPCAFIETSIEAAVPPQIKRAAPSAQALEARAGNISTTEKTPDERELTRLLPYRLISIPTNGIVTTDPKAAQSNVEPKTPLLKWRALCTAGIRDTHVATIRPCNRNSATVAHHARETVFIFACKP